MSLSLGFFSPSCYYCSLIFPSFFIVLFFSSLCFHLWFDWPLLSSSICATPPLCCDTLHHSSNCTVICMHGHRENNAHCVQCSLKVSYTLQTYVAVFIPVLQIVCTVFRQSKKEPRRLQIFLFGDVCTSILLFSNKKIQVCFNVWNRLQLTKQGYR